LPLLPRAIFVLCSRFREFVAEAGAGAQRSRESSGIRTDGEKTVANPRPTAGAANRVATG
jgi:hypothetical protein